MLDIRLIVRIVKAFDFLKSLINGARIRNVKRRKLTRFIHVALYVGSCKLLVESISIDVTSQSQTFHTGRTHKVFPAVLLDDLLLQCIFGQGGNLSYLVGKSDLFTVDTLHSEIARKKRHVQALLFTALDKPGIIQGFFV